ncbi:DUF3375 family protein, partial [Dermatophilus congolensis]
MTSDTGELHQNYTDILNHPALTLLRRRDAALILTILTKAFGTSGTPVPQDRMHGLTEATLIETEGTDPTTGRPTRTGRELCDTWLTGNTRWLTRILAPNGQDEAYRMTPEAEHALAFVTELTRTHIVTTATTVETLLEAAHRCAIKASTAPTERKRLLTQRRNELTQQLNDIDTQLATIDTTPITPEPNHTVLNEYLSVHNGLETLLRDLRNISTTVRAQGDQLRHEFQTDTRETGTIIDEYLQRLSVLFSRTREGQGFESAQRLLNNPTRVNNLRNDIDTILNHPFATTLPPEHTATTRRMVNAINRGIAEVIDARNHLHTTFTRYLRSRHAPNHNLLPTRIRELEAAL